MISGITMVFMPSVTTFAVSKLLGNGMVKMLGDIIENQFMVANEWGFGSALSMFMMVLMLISIGLLNLLDKPKAERSDKW